MTQPPDWAIQVPSVDVNSPPTNSTALENSAQRLVDLRGNFIELILREVVRALTGVLGIDSDAFTQLQEWAADIPILGDIIEALTGVEDGDLNDLGTWVLDLEYNINTFFRSVIEYNLNVLTNPLLETAASLQSSPDWTWDPAIRHGFVGGSANVNGDGLVHQLGSNPILPVAPNQNIAASTWVRWSNVVCSGPAFQLVLYRYDGTNPSTAVVIGQEILESFSNPVADSFELFNNNFIKLDGNYTITDAETKGVRLVWRQTANVVAGQSWWHDASMTKASDDFTRKMQNIDIDGNFDLTKVFNQVPANRVGGVGGAPDIGKALTDTWNALVGGFLSLFGITGQTPADVQAAAAGVAGSASNAVYATETLQGFFNEPRILPAYVGSLSDDVAFDRDGVDGTTTPTLGTLLLIPVKITQDRVIDAIKVGCTGSVAVTHFYVGLYDCDETTGDLAKVIDLGDRKADLDTAFGQQTFELTDPVAVQKGELYYIAVLQTGGTAVAMHRRSLTFNITDGLFPKYLGNTWSTTGISTLPSTIDETQLLTGTRYWGALGTATEPLFAGGVFLSDSFNRPDNSSSFGSNWTIRYGAGGIFSGRPIRNFFTDTAIVTHNTRLNSTTQRGGMKIFAAGAGEGQILLRGNGSGRYVFLRVNSVQHVEGSDVTYPTTATIYTSTAYNTGAWTLRATVTSGAFQGSWTFDAVGNTYTAYLGGIQRVQWVDAGGAFTVNANNTEVGFAIGDAVADSVMDDWFAQDL